VTALLRPQSTRNAGNGPDGAFRAPPADVATPAYGRAMPMDHLLALRTDERAALLLVGLRGDW
jgi:hypothetical protein